MATRVSQATSGAHGLFPAQTGKPARDESWREEVEFETIRSVAETEQRAIYSEVVGWLILAAAAFTMPNATLFTLPLLARLAAIIGTRLSWNKLRAEIAMREPLRKTMFWLAVILALSGASWALVLLPVLIDPFLHPARLALGGGTFVSLAMVALMLCTQPRLLLSFLAGFSLSLTIGLAMAPEFMGLRAFIFVHGILIAIGGFAYSSSRQRTLTSEMLVENRRLSEELASSLAHAEFLMRRDPLTGLRNRRSLFEEQWPEMFGLEDKHILAIDLDHFKRINDTHGHATGDIVLIAVAGILRECEDTLPGGPHVAARLGGEEFVLVLTGIERSLAVSTAELIRLRIEGIALALRGKLSVPTSASIGLVTIGDDKSLDAALKQSDLAMYRAKDRGRNRVESAAA